MDPPAGTLHSRSHGISFQKKKFSGLPLPFYGDVKKEPPYLHASSGKSAQGGLGSGSRGFGPVATSGAQLDVQGRYAQGFH
jgi:hypothetical protein